jgi:sulfate/thiosulfate transport system permease protein
MARPSPRIIPGFPLTLGYTLTYLSLLVLIPLGALILKSAQLSWGEFWGTMTDPTVVSAFKVTFKSATLAAVINAIFGLLVAWVLVRYPMPGRRFFDAMIDFPFALPTAVAGLVYATLYVKNGWLGQFLVPLGIEGAYTRLGIVLVLVFTGFPFVVRTVQPVLEALDAETEEAAQILGATRWQTFRRVILPTLIPALVTGFALAFARAVGEYGSVVFISGNMPYETEIAPVLIVSRLEEFAYREATAIAVVLLSVSFVLLAVINLLERWSKRHAG